jgi:hypothetical protein
MVLAVGALAAGCAHVAAVAVADAVSGPGKVYARDDDPELVRAAIPVLLKTMEQLYESVPNHRGLLTSLVSTCTSLSAAWLTDDADRMQEQDVERARPLSLRARRMSLRGREYGLRGLELALPGARAALEGPREKRAALLARAGVRDVPLLYWTAAAWGSAIAVSKGDMKLVGELPVVGELMQRALDLDETWNLGAIHEFFITYDAARGVGQGGGPERARQHYLRARELSQNKKLSPIVSYVEAVTVDKQDKKEFTRLLGEVLAFDVDSALDYRLVNTLAQRRARWLLSRADDLFAE